MRVKFFQTELSFIIIHHIYNHIPLFVTTLNIAEGLGDLFQRVAPTNNSF